MVMTRSKQASSSSSSYSLVWVLVAGLLSQNLVLTVMSTSFEDQKNYYPPDPHAGSRSPPTGLFLFVNIRICRTNAWLNAGSGSGSHGSPHHGTPPSHGSGGGYGGAPPSHGGDNCGNPPVDPGTPSTPSAPSHTPTPSTPSHTPTPSTPSVPSGGSPPTPIIVGPPTTPGIPSITPTPPFLPTNPFPGTCNYWLTHPTLIWGVVGWWGTIGSLFGLHSIPGVSPSLSLQQALSNTRTDGFGALYREGTASLLNSMASNKFPFTTQQVRNSFVAALSSDKAAASQARLFKLANEGRLKPRT